MSPSPRPSLSNPLTPYLGVFLVLCLVPFFFLTALLNRLRDAWQGLRRALDRGDGASAPLDLLVPLKNLAFFVTFPFVFARWADAWLRWWVANSSRRWMVFILLASVLCGFVATRDSRLDLRYRVGGVDRDIPGPGPSRLAWFEQERVRRAAEGPEDIRLRGSETVYLPPHEVLRFAALGHQGFMADLLFVRVHGYWSSHLWLDRRFPWLDLYMNAIIALDPDNERIYYWASQVVKYGQLIDEATIEKSNHYSRLGIERFPDNFEYYLAIGHNYLFEGQVKNEADRAERLKRALPYIEIATTLPGTRLDPNFVMELHERNNDQAAALHLASITYWKTDPKQRRTMRARMIRMGQDARAQNMKRTGERHAKTFPYIREIGLFRLVDPDTSHDTTLPSDWSKPWEAPSPTLEAPDPRARPNEDR